jgi:cell division protease FtsH
LSVRRPITTLVAATSASAGFFNKNLLLWLVLGSVLTSIFSQFQLSEQKNDVTYSQFIQSVKQGDVSQVTIAGSHIKGVGAGGEEFSTYSPGDLGLMGDLLDNGVNVIAKPPEQEGFFKQLIISLAPILLLIGVILYTMKGAGGAMGGKNPMSFGKSKARLITKDESNVTFKDVAGVDEAKAEVMELVDFLSDPGKFTKVGGKIPKGVLMVGPPGTGKTLLAKAIAGEADVPFFFISGSDFVEMFVGVGASRVRDMFEQAKKSAPCIIFIDEIDAVGRQRGAGMGGGHDEREQTLNQMLVEMDGFEGNEGIIVIAATNRPDVLDPALLRPGRFDRQVTVGLPDINGRDAILKVHMRKLPIAKNVKSINIAKGTPGFSGADLANLANEAALIAAGKGKDLVGMQEFEKAKDKIMMGSERKSMVMDEAEKEMTAYHEAGHAIVGRLVPEHDPVYKVSIIPRGRALGVTMFLPEKDSYSISKRKLNSQVSSLFGGRIAEELIYGTDSVTTGASNDIERATEIAHKMVKHWGMSKALGPLAYGEDDGEVFLGRQVTKHKHISDKTFDLIDIEIRKIIDVNYDIAYKILEENKDILHAMAKSLIEIETIDKDQIDDLMNRKPMREAAVIIDSDVASTELGSGVDVPKDTSSDSDEKPLGGSGTQQTA